MKHLKNENYHLKVQSACHKENVVAVVTKAIEKERVITTKKIALITTAAANKMSGRLGAVQNRNLVMSNTNRNKVVNLKEKYKIELDCVRNKLEEKHIVVVY